MRTTSWVLGFGLVLAALAVPAGASALSISPTSRVIAAPGTVDYTITNTSRVAVNVLLKFVDYTIAANGSAQFPNTTPPRSARKWLSVSPKAVVLAPGKAATVQVHARLGRAAPPGDWQALLVARETSTAPSVRDKKRVSVVVQVGVAVTIRVPRRPAAPARGACAPPTPQHGHRANLQLGQCPGGAGRAPAGRQTDGHVPASAVLGGHERLRHVSSAGQWPGAGRRDRAAAGDPGYPHAPADQAGSDAPPL